MRKYAALLALMTLGGCMSVAERTSHRVPVTPEMKATIVAKLRDFLKDPYSVMDAEISNGMPGFQGAVIICLKMNSKNSFGAYIGRKETLVEMRDGRVTNINEGDSIYCTSDKLEYRPFPEIYTLRKT